MSLRSKAGTALFALIACWIVPLSGAHAADAVAEETVSGQGANADSASQSTRVKEHAKRMRDLREQIDNAVDPELKLKLQMQHLQSIGCGPS